MTRRRRRVAAGTDVLQLVRRARSAAADALDSIRTEIGALRNKLEDLVAEEKDFVADLFGGEGRRASRGRRRGRLPGRAPRSITRRRGPAKADRFFVKLPQRFTIEQVRAVAGRLSGVSLAQWSRAKKVRKTGSGYEKIGQGRPSPAGAIAASRAAAKRARPRRRRRAGTKKRGRPKGGAAAAAQ